MARRQLFSKYFLDPKYAKAKIYPVEDPNGGGGGGGGGGGTPALVITSFNASKSTLTLGLTGGLTAFTYSASWSSTSYPTSAVVTGPNGYSRAINVSTENGTSIAVTYAQLGSSGSKVFTLTLTRSTDNTTATATFTVNALPAPTIVSFSVTPTTISSGGQNITFNASFSGGTGKVYGGDLNGSVITSGTALTVTGPLTTQTYYLIVDNGDLAEDKITSTGSPATATLTVSGTSTPTINSFSASPSGSVNVNDIVTISGTFSNGTGLLKPNVTINRSNSAGSVTAASGIVVTSPFTMGFVITQEVGFTLTVTGT